MPIRSVAHEVVRRESETVIFDHPPNVKIVHLGSTATPIIAVGKESWINMDVDTGKRITQEICDRNEGHVGVWVACLKHAPGKAHQIVNALTNCPMESNKLGPIMRRFIRDLIA